MQEYDLEIKPTKLVKRQGMAKLMARSNYQAISLNIMTTNIMGGMILGAKFLSWANFPCFFQKRDSLF
jgi:hypothetical protein